MTSLLYKLIVFLIIYSSITFSQQGWIEQVSLTTNYLYCVSFVSSSTGWACGQNGTILKTTNGGVNWFPQLSGLTGFLYTIFFIDANTGWAAGQNGALRKTTNGGTNWNGQSSSFNQYIYSNFFTDVLTGYYCGSGGTIYKTTDGGTLWVQKSSGVTGTLSCMHFPVSATSMVGYISGGTATEGIILKTSNAGENWTQLTGTGTNWMFGIYFTDLQNGWAGGINGAMLRTTNGGTNWLTQITGTTNRIVQLSFANNNTGWAVGYTGSIVYTTNGGNNWVTQTTPTTQNLWGVDFIDENTGWAVGWTGTILHTTNGGMTIVKQISSEIPQGFKLFQNYPNPFNPATSINIDIPVSSYVKLNVYDILGNESGVLVDQMLNAGSYQVDWNASNYPSGVYVYKLDAGNFSQTRKMILIK